METLLSLLYSLHSETDPAKRKFIEPELQKYGNDPDTFVVTMAQLLATPSMPAGYDVESVKKTASIYLHNYLQGLIVHKLIDFHQMQLSLKSLLEVPLNSYISPAVSANLVKSVEHLCNTPEGCSDSISKQILEFILPFLISVLNSYQNVVSLQGFLKCVGEILKSMFLHAEFIDPASELLNQIGVIGKLEAKTLAPEKIGVVGEILKIHSMLFASERLKGKSCFDTTAASQDLAELLDICIKFSLEPQFPASFLVSTADPMLNNAVNNLKHKAWKTLNELIEYSLQDNLKTLPVYAISLGIGHDAVLFVMNLCKHSYFPEEGISMSKEHQKILLDIMRFIKQLLEDTTFNQVCAPFKEELLLSLVLPALRTNKEELEGMTKDPDNFVNLALDTCDEQNSKVLKAEAAGLLEAICEQLDGALTFLSTLVADLINYACCHEHQTSLLEKYRTKFFIATTPPIFVIETCIVAVTVVSYLTNQRKDVMYTFSLTRISAKLEETLVNNWKTLYNHPDQLLRSRIALMLGYYADTLYYHQREIFFNTFVFLFQGLGMENTEKAFSLQCADTLKAVIEDPDLVARLKKDIQGLLPYITSLVENQNRVFDILSSIIANYKTELTDLTGLMEGLLKRIDKEYAGKGKRSSLAINQCLGIFEDICRYKETAESAEPYLEQLCQYLALVESIDFEDEILGIIGVYMKTTGEQFKGFTKVFQWLFLVFEKHKEVSMNLFVVLNYGLVYNQDYIEWNFEAVLHLITSAMRKMEHEDSVKGCLLMQVMLQVFGDHKLDSYIPSIVKNVFETTKSVMEDYVRQAFLNVIICSLCNYSELTIKSLLAENQLEETMASICKPQASRLKHPYDTKLHCMGMLSLLMQVNTVPQISKVAVQLFVSLVEMLYKQYKQGKERGDSEASSSSEEEKMAIEENYPQNETESEASDDEDSSVTNIKKLLDQLEAPVKKLDEFQYFTEIMKVVHSGNPEQYDALIRSLNKTQEKQYKTLLQSKRMKVNGQEGTTRKIVKPKRVMKH